MSWHIEFSAIDKDEARQIINSKADGKIPINVLEHLRDMVDSLSDADAPQCLLFVKSFGHLGSGAAGNDARANVTCEVSFVPRYAR